MSILVGKAKKFSSSSNPAKVETGFNAPVSGKPIAPVAYQGVRTGPGTSIEFEDVQQLPIDGSDPSLRNLSPFIFRLEPPLVYNSSPAWLKTGGKPNIGIYEAGGNTQNSYASARANLATYGFVGKAAGASTEEFISKSYSEGGHTGTSGDGLKVSPSGQPLNDRQIGQPAIADLNKAVDAATQLAAILNTPPLVLLINPQSLNIQYQKIQQYQDRTRHGYVFQAWGEDQPRLSITAKCGAYISGNRGVQYASKRDSAAWQNLMSLFHFYHNNGYIHDTVDKSNAHLFVGAMSIHYDGWIWYGNMESLSYSYDEQTQLGGMTFEVQFVVTSVVDTHESTPTVSPLLSPVPSLSDPRYMGMQKGARRGANTVGVNVDGSVDGQAQLSIGINETASERVFGSQASTPASWRAKDVGTTTASVSQGAAPQSASRGTRGFSKVVASTTTPVGLSDDPDPFKVG